MTITTLQILVTFQVLIWFDWIKVQNILLKALGYEVWTKKKDLPFLLKWIACYFCTSFWIGVINAIVNYCLTGNLQLSLLLIMSNLIMSRLLDYLLGYQSFKP